MRTIKELKNFARINKKRDVSSEKSFRKFLKLHGVHYQKQKVIGNYIVDFYFPKRNLIVEIDENHHKYQKEYDAIRQATLEGYGYSVIRFTDKEVYENPFMCYMKIASFRESKEWYRECKHRLSIINSNNKKPH